MQSNIYTSLNDLSNLINNIVVKVDNLLGTEDNEGTIKYTQSIVNEQIVIMNSLPDLQSLYRSVEDLNDALDTAIKYISDLGDGINDEKILNQIQDKLYEIKDVYSNYVSTYNSFNDPNGLLQISLNKLVDDIWDLVNYTSLQDIYTNISMPIVLQPDTINPITFIL